MLINISKQDVELLITILHTVGPAGIAAFSRKPNMTVSRAIKLLKKLEEIIKEK